MADSVAGLIFLAGGLLFAVALYMGIGLLMDVRMFLRRRSK